MTVPSRLGQPDPGHTPAGSRIASLGYYLPAQVLSTEEVARRTGTDPEWIRSRTGIEERHVAATDETVVDMAVSAAAKALATGGVPEDSVDAVIVATSTAATTIPSAAAQVAARLELDHPGAFDLNTACAGFCTALACADSFIRSGTARNVLVVGADKATAWVDWHDRDTAILFGDGAGAALITPAQTPRIGPVVWGTAGEKHRAIVIDEAALTFRQDGQAVFRWATGLGPVARQICERTGISVSELAAFVPHQANLRIINSLARSLGATDTVVATDVRECGNTIAATVPMALARLLERGTVAPGSPVLLLGFGAGLAYAGQVVTL